VPTAEILIALLATAALLTPHHQTNKLTVYFLLANIIQIYQEGNSEFVISKKDVVKMDTHILNTTEEIL
jgi:hypothetical protein